MKKTNFLQCVEAAEAVAKESVFHQNGYYDDAHYDGAHYDNGYVDSHVDNYYDNNDSYHDVIYRGPNISGGEDPKDKKKKSWLDEIEDFFRVMFFLFVGFLAFVFIMCILGVFGKD